MHTISVILGGLALLAIFIFAARATGRSLRSLLPAYLLTWLAGAALNMWIGVARAGYSLAQELPIFLVVFAVPAAAAILLAKRG